jgi:hypothetical protein
MEITIRSLADPLIMHALQLFIGPPSGLHTLEMWSPFLGRTMVPPEDPPKPVDVAAVTKEYLPALSIFLLGDLSLSWTK